MAAAAVRCCERVCETDERIDRQGDRLMASAREIVVVHTSDVHVDHVYTAQIHGGDGAGGLACVLDSARALGADVVMLAGDTFDCHRLPDTLIDRAASVIAESGVQVVLLPGNHDPVV